jgi:hypothetical protein
MTNQLPRVVELDREGLYFIANDGNYWVYVDAVDREAKVFRDMKEAIAYGLHTTPESISIEIIDKGIETIGDKGWEIRYRNYVVKVCMVGGECEEYRAWA